MALDVLMSDFNTQNTKLKVSISDTFNDCHSQMTQKDDKTKFQTIKDLKSHLESFEKKFKAINDFND